MRLDKMISNYISKSRTDVKKLIKSGLVLVNGTIVKDNDYDVIESDEIIVDGSIIDNRENIVIMLNKPKGIISATIDKKQKTVIDLVATKYKRKKLFPAGRLDKDTTGLMIITNDGALAHSILSPRKHVEKTYEVKTDGIITDDIKDAFREGVDIGDAICKTAILEKIDDYNCIVKISEGRYHQIKRMFEKFSLNVIELNRISIGNLVLDKNLMQGEFRELTVDEIKLLKGENLYV